MFQLHRSLSQPSKHKGTKVLHAKFIFLYVDECSPVAHYQQDPTISADDDESDNSYISQLTHTVMQFAAISTWLLELFVKVLTQHWT